MYRPKKVVAIDILDVFRVMKKFDKTYSDIRVESIVMDGRKYFERTDELFSLIYLAFVDPVPFLTGPRVSLDPFQYLYTLEGLEAFQRHLEEDGILVIARFFYGILDREFVNRVVSNLLHLRLKVKTFCKEFRDVNSFICMILAGKHLKIKKIEERMGYYGLKEYYFTPIKITTDSNPFSLGTSPRTLGFVFVFVFEAILIFCIFLFPLPTFNRLCSTSLCI